MTVKRLIFLIMALFLAITSSTVVFAEGKGDSRAEAFGSFFMSALDVTAGVLANGAVHEGSHYIVGYTLGADVDIRLDGSFSVDHNEADHLRTVAWAGYTGSALVQEALISTGVNHKYPEFYWGYVS